jgi:hypothetical protein
MSNRTKKPSRIYDPYTGELVTDWESRPNDYVKSCISNDKDGVMATYEDWKADGFEGTLEDCVLSNMFMDAPRSEDLIQSELKRLRKQKPPTKSQFEKKKKAIIARDKVLISKGIPVDWDSGSRTYEDDTAFETGMIRGKIEILEAVLNNVEFEDVGELWDKVWYGRFGDGRYEASREPARRLKEQYGEEKLMEWANNYSNSEYGWGVLSGKFSAVRWLNGEEWDNLDT